MPLKKQKLVSFQRTLPRALDAAAKETAQAGLGIRNGLVPVDTGELKESGEILAGPQLGHWVIREGAGLPDARARYTEFGTARQAAQPHLTPAAEQCKPILRANVAKRVKGIIK